MDLSAIFSPAIDLLKKFFGFTFSFYGVSLQVEDVFIFVLLFAVVLGIFNIFKHT